MSATDTVLLKLWKNSKVDNVAAITPSDTVDLDDVTVGIYVGVDGDVKIITASGQTIIMKNLASGMWHPIHATRVFATGTTATDILGAW